jgi:hypothetical protein
LEHDKSRVDSRVFTVWAAENQDPLEALCNSISARPIHSSFWFVLTGLTLRIRGEITDVTTPKSTNCLFRVCVPDVEFFIVSDGLNVQIIGSRRAMNRGTKISQTNAAHIGQWNLKS